MQGANTWMVHHLQNVCGDFGGKVNGIRLFESFPEVGN